MIVLASSSPRRAELLKLITPNFEVEHSRADERSGITDPAALVTELAFRKARDVHSRRPNDTVIGADTIVYINGKILGKPADLTDARQMMETLAGNTHEVYTGVCVINGDDVKTNVCKTRVTFAPMSAAEIDAYMATAHVTDKAGAYAVQGEAAKHITGIEGCFYNVMGLPVNMTYNMLNEIGNRK